MLDGWAAANHLLNIHLAANFFLEIKFLLRKFILQFGNFLVGQSVFNCNCNLTRCLGEKFNIIWSERSLASTCDRQKSQRSTSIDQRNQASALQAFGNYFVVYFGRDIDGIGTVDDLWLHGLKNSLPGTDVCDNFLFPNESFAGRKIEGVQPG